MSYLLLGPSHSLLSDFDYFHDRSNKDNSHGGQRIATMLMYLATPEDGGETVFPNADRKVSGPGWSDCARKGFAVHPRKGDAVLFFSLKPDGTEDPSSLHGSCPVLKGEKWSATKWMVGEGIYLDVDSQCPVPF